MIIRTILQKSILKILIINLLLSYNLFSNEVNLGIDVLEESNFNVLKGKRVALFTNQSGVNKFGRRTLDIFLESKNINLIKVFVPEHGYFTTIPAGETVLSTRYKNIDLVSLYGSNKIPSKSILEEVDLIVVDIQDIGIRSYTYVSSLYYLMQGCAKNNIPMLILDRPNPLGGIIVDGNLPKKEWISFVSLIKTPYIHGMTIGEIALYINEESLLGNNLKVSLDIVLMKNWERWMQWEDTNINWVPTSPHIPTVNSIRGAAFQGIFGELGVISIGIGTTSPFQYIGSLSLNLDNIKKDFEFVSLLETYYRPFYGMFSGKDVKGYYLNFSLSNLSKPYTEGILLYSEIIKKNPKLVDIIKEKGSSINMFKKVTGCSELYESLINKLPTDKIEDILKYGISDFLIVRNQYLLY